MLGLSDDVKGCKAKVSSMMSIEPLAIVIIVSPKCLTVTLGLLKCRATADSKALLLEVSRRVVQI